MAPYEMRARASDLRKLLDSLLQEATKQVLRGSDAFNDEKLNKMMSLVEFSLDDMLIYITRLEMLILQ